MPKTTPKLVIVSRDALFEIEPLPESELVFRELANINRHGVQLLLTASAPDHWVPTRGNVDGALKQQRVIQDRIQRSGGDLDGVYYVPRSLLTQDRNRTGALQDILKRYGVAPQQAVLISYSAPFLRAAERLGIGTMSLERSDRDVAALLAILKKI